MEFFNLWLLNNKGLKLLMTQFDIINISVNNTPLANQSFLDLLLGNWYPKNFETNPLQFVFNNQITPIYYCTDIDLYQRRVVLSEKCNQKIIIEVFIINPNKITFSIVNIEAIGASPKIVFER